MYMIFIHLLKKHEFMFLVPPIPIQHHRDLSTLSLFYIFFPLLCF